MCREKTDKHTDETLGRGVYLCKQLSVWVDPLAYLITMKHCKFIKTDGTECKGFAVNDDDFCFAHSEKYKAKHKQAVLKGGKSLKRSYADKEPVLLRTNEDAVYLSEQVINELRANQISTKTANILAILINLSLKAIPLALKDKEKAKNIKLYNEGKMDLKFYLEELKGAVRCNNKSVLNNGK